jgi:hypothetical protein
MSLGWHIVHIYRVHTQVTIIMAETRAATANTTGLKTDLDRGNRLNLIIWTLLYGSPSIENPRRKTTFRPPRSATKSLLTRLRSLLCSPRGGFCHWQPPNADEITHTPDYSPFRFPALAWWTFSSILFLLRCQPYRHRSRFLLWCYRAFMDKSRDVIYSSASG